MGLKLKVEDVIDQLTDKAPKKKKPRVETKAKIAGRQKRKRYNKQIRKEGMQQSITSQREEMEMAKEPQRDSISSAEIDPSDNSNEHTSDENDDQIPKNKESSQNGPEQSDSQPLVRQRLITDFLVPLQPKKGPPSVRGTEVEGKDMSEAPGEKLVQKCCTDADEVTIQQRSPIAGQNTNGSQLQENPI